MNDAFRRGGETEVRACGRCRFAIKYVPAGQIQSQLQCRRGPPAVIVLPLQNVKTGQLTWNIQSFPPPLPENHWCYEYIPLPEGQSLPIESGNVQNAGNGS